MKKSILAALIAISLAPATALAVPSGAAFKLPGYTQNQDPHSIQRSPHHDAKRDDPPSWEQQCAVRGYEAVVGRPGYCIYIDGA